MEERQQSTRGGMCGFARVFVMKGRGRRAGEWRGGGELGSEDEREEGWRGREGRDMDGKG